jgi:CRISPR-associated endonuclease Cas2
MFCVIGYDCTDDRRRLRVAKVLEDYGYRVQYSVFEAELDEKTLAEMVKRVCTHKIRRRTPYRSTGSARGVSVRRTWQVRPS